MANLARHRRTPLTRRLALLGAPALVLGVVACGDMEPPKDAATGSVAPAVTSSAGAPSSGDPMPTTGSSVSAVIGGWAARYGSARNDVQTALSALGSAQSSEAVTKAAAEALNALKAASDVPTCPDPATEEAYRSAVEGLTAKVTELATSGDVTAAQQVAADGSTAFDSTEQALLAVYG
jgi:hypothetical protein